MGLTFVTEDQPDLTLPEDSVHTARLLEIKPRTINWTNADGAQTRDVLEWWWEITKSSDDQYVGRRVKGECAAKISNHPNNRFHAWAETLLGRQIPVGMGIDTDDLIGLQAEISIGHRQDKKDSNKVWEYVDEVMPVDGGFDLNEPPF